MRRFRYTTDYPGNYSPELRRTDQSPVPSQNNATPKPYYPAYPADLIQRSARTSPDNLAIVRAQFDSRPVNAFDMYFEDAYFDAGPVSWMAGYTVPQGYTLILRRLGLQLLPSEAIAANTPAGPLQNQWMPRIDPYGNIIQFLTADGGRFATLQITVNGVATPISILSSNAPYKSVNGGTGGGGGIGLFHLGYGEYEVDTFLTASENSVVNIIVDPLTDTLGAFPSGFNLYVQYYGNLLLSDGRQTTLQVGNGDPEPVRQA